MDLATTAFSTSPFTSTRPSLDGIFRLNAVLHNTGQLQRLTKPLDKFVL